MKKELKEKVQNFFKEHSDLSLVYKEFKGLVYPDTLKRWCCPEEGEKARLKAKERHQRNKDNPEYKEKQRLRSEQNRQKEEYKKFQKEYYENHKEKIQENVRKHRQEHLDQYRQKSKDHYQNNKERYKNWSSKYREENKERLQSLELARYHNDPITHLKQSLRMSLNRALKHGKNIKTNKALQYLGCPIEEFKAYLENRFLGGMSWSNRKDWHLDHIIPLDKINEGYTLEQLCHYSNIQPLWEKDNLSKGNRLNLELSFSLEELKREKEYYLKTPGNYFQVPPQNKIVLNFQPHFYEKERLLWSNPDIQKKLLTNREKYLGKTADHLSVKEILRGFKISGIHYGYSHFSSLWIKKFLEDFKVKTIYDPCGGWGHRMVGLLGTSIEKYIYNDFDSRTARGVEKIRDFLELNERVEIYNRRAEEFVPESFVDCIFTCPPYYNKETYNLKSFKTLEDFSNWWSKVVENSLKLNPQYFAVIIDSEHQNIISKPLEKFPLILEQKILKKQSHFNLGTKAKESLLIFFISKDK